MKATIVIHSRVRSVIGAETSMEWHSVTATGKAGSVVVDSEEIDRAEARRIIDKYGLVIAHEEADGEIYDTPDGDFKALFPLGATSQLLSKLRRNGL